MCLLIDDFQTNRWPRYRISFSHHFSLYCLFVTQFLLKRTPGLLSRKCYLDYQITYNQITRQLSASSKEDTKSIEETKNTDRFVSLLSTGANRGTKKRESMVANANKRATRINRCKRERSGRGRDTLPKFRPICHPSEGLRKYLKSSPAPPGHALRLIVPSSLVTVNAS